jgi:predicted acetyltransferase
MGGIVRHLENDDEVKAYWWGMRTAFLDGKDITDEAVAWAQKLWDFDRIWAAFDDDGTQCATTRTFPSQLCLPGLAQVPVSCLTQVTCLPTHTRRGHVTRLMRAQLEAAIDAGEVASLLVAAEWPIYGRFGYGPITQWTEWRVDVDRSVLKPTLPPPVGRTKLCVSGEEFVGPLEEVHLANQAVTPGSIVRLPYMHALGAGLDQRPGEERKESRVRLVHFDADGEPDGFVVYDPKDVWDGMRPRCVLKVEDMAWTTPAAERELWRYLLTVDLVSTIEYDGSPSSAVRHLVTDGRAVHAAGTWDFLWAVVLDIPKAFSARAYAAPGRAVVKVVDAFLGRGGTYTWDDGVVTETPAATADLTLPLAALSAAWLGGTDLRHLAVDGSIVEHTPGALDAFAALLRWHQVPDSFTEF